MKKPIQQPQNHNMSLFYFIPYLNLKYYEKWYILQKSKSCSSSLLNHKGLVHLFFIGKNLKCPYQESNLYCSAIHKGIVQDCSNGDIAGGWVSCMDIDESCPINDYWINKDTVYVKDGCGGRIHLCYTRGNVKVNDNTVSFMQDIFSFLTFMRMLTNIWKKEILI